MKKSFFVVLALIMFAVLSFSGSVLADDDELEGYVLSVEGNGFIMSTKYGDKIRVPIPDGVKIKDKYNIGLIPGAKVEVKFDRAGEIYKLKVEGLRKEQGRQPGTTTIEQNTNMSKQVVDPPVWQMITIQAENRESMQLRVTQDNGHILAPIKAVAEYLDGTLVWYPKSMILEVTKGEEQLLFRINKRVMFKNLEKVSIPQAPLLKDDVVYVPLTALMKVWGYNLEWNEVNQVYMITQNK